MKTINKEEYFKSELDDVEKQLEIFTAKRQRLRTMLQVDVVKPVTKAMIAELKQRPTMISEPTQRGDEIIPDADELASERLKQQQIPVPKKPIYTETLNISPQEIVADENMMTEQRAMQLAKEWESKRQQPVQPQSQPQETYGRPPMQHQPKPQRPAFFHPRTISAPVQQPQQQYYAPISQPPSPRPNPNTIIYIVLFAIIAVFAYIFFKG